MAPPSSDRDSAPDDARPSDPGPLRRGGQLPARRLTTPPPPLSPEDAARFDDEGEVARGGMSSIHAVVDRRLARREAMKVLELPAEATLERSHRAAHRFLEEARITGQLDHPNIVPVYDLGLSVDGAPSYMTMKLVEGEAFGDWIDRLGDARLDPDALEHAITVLLKVCDAVAFAHGKGVIHCDIKPSNIMVGSFGQVYLMDWGLAVTTSLYSATSVKGWQPRPLRPGTIAGSPAYMAPEQALGLVEKLNETTDVFGLGATLYRVLTGQSPYNEPTVKGTIARAREGKIMPCDAIVIDPRLPPELARIAMKALSFEPTHRHPSALAFKSDLEGFLRGGGWLPTQTFAEGEVILREGEEARAAYVLLDGVVEVYKTVNGRRLAIRLMGPGDVFGEAAVFSSRPRSASVVAKSDVTVKVITAESMERELSKNAALKALVRALAHRFRELDMVLTQHELDSQG
ncbi:MAG: cyclic nucleotide-binding domain-containing protein [Polyangiaceae bacterium]|nr:cyclic nucleotide-binding domain-containing protein [Polyangiaceae bacterium]